MIEVTNFDLDIIIPCYNPRVNSVNHLLKC